MARSKRGFTLLELLLLLLIVGLLAAVLYPAFTRAASVARERTCLSNLNQLAQAVLLYAHDWDGCAPGVENPYAIYAGSPPWPRNENALWQINIAAYAKDRSIYSCPSAEKRYTAGSYDSDPTLINIDGIPVPASWKGVTMSYGINVLLQLSYRVPRAGDYDGDQLDPNFPSTWFNWEAMCNGMPPNTGWGGRNLSRLSSPSRVILVSDSSRVAETCGRRAVYSEICGWELPDPACDFSSATPANARHNGGNNWAFADGHSRWVRAGQYRCISGFCYIPTDAEILAANSLQKVLGIDQLN